MSVGYKLPQIVKRDGGQWICHYCGYKLIPNHIQMGDANYYDHVGRWNNGDPICRLKKQYRYPVVDHVIPKSKGGSNSLENLVAACWECNAHKAAKSYEQFTGRQNEQV